MRYVLFGLIKNALEKWVDNNFQDQKKALNSVLFSLSSQFFSYNGSYFHVTHTAIE